MMTDRPSVPPAPADPGKRIFSFQVMSDTEILASGSPNNRHFDMALSAVEKHAPDSRAVFITGDVVTRGTAENWACFRAIAALHPGIPKIRCAVGNHDLTDDGTYGELYGNFLRYSGMPGTYFDEWICGFHFIVIGQEAAGHNKPEYSGEQFRWLEEKLAEHASYDKPVFLFSHYSLRNTTAGTFLGSQIGHAAGGEDKRRFMELLKRFPQVIYFTGHTHFALTDPRMRFNTDVRNGRGADIVSSGSVSYLCAGTYEEIEGAQFCFVDVYERCVKVRGWDILGNRWMDNAAFTVDTASKTPVSTAAPAVSWSAERADPPALPGLAVTVTCEDPGRVGAEDGAWVGLVRGGAEGEPGETLRWARLKDLPRDTEGRFLWNVADDAVCGEGSEPWRRILGRGEPLRAGLFEDTLYLGRRPTVPEYRDFRFDPYALAAEAEIPLEALVRIRTAE